MKASLRHATLEAAIADHPEMARAASLRGQSVAASAEARGSRSWSKERQHRGEAAAKAWKASENAEAAAIKEVSVHRDCLRGSFTFKLSQLDVDLRRGSKVGLALGGLCSKGWDVWTEVGRDEGFRSQL